VISPNLTENATFNAVSKLFNPLHRIPHNSTNLQKKVFKGSRDALVASGVLELEHMKYINWFVKCHV